MPLYVSCIEPWQDNRKRAYDSLLLMSQALEILHSTGQNDFETAFYDNLLLDFFELNNYSADEVPYVFLPSGSPVLVFPLYPQRARSYLCGPLTSARRIVVPPNGKIFFVRLRVGGLKWLVKQSVASLSDQVVPLNTFLVDAMQMQGELRKQNTFRQRCSTFLNDLERCGAKEFCVDPMTQICVDMICERQGIGRVYELAAAINRSERFLGSVFRDTTGMSMKKYFEIVKFKNSLSAILISRPHVLTDVVRTYGYYDLPHMNRAYRTFLGYTASEVRYLNVEDLYVPELFHGGNF